MWGRKCKCAFSPSNYDVHFQPFITTRLFAFPPFEEYICWSENLPPSSAEYDAEAGNRKFSHVSRCRPLVEYSFISLGIYICQNRRTSMHPRRDIYFFFFCTPKLPRSFTLCAPLFSSNSNWRRGREAGRKEEHPVSSIAHFLCRSENALWGKGTKVCAEIQYDWLGCVPGWVSPYVSIYLYEFKAIGFLLRAWRYKRFKTNLFIHR